MASHVHPPREVKIARIPSSLDLDPSLMRGDKGPSEASLRLTGAAEQNFRKAHDASNHLCTERLPGPMLSESKLSSLMALTNHSFSRQSGTGEQGKNMMEAEYLGVKEIHAVMPEFAPKPHGWGKYENSDTYFFYMEFLDLSQEEMPEPDEFCCKLAKLHEISKSPTGKFGFYRSTFQGPIEMNNTWESNWCTFVTRLLTGLFDREVAQNGSWPAYEEAFGVFKTKTIKQILEPLQSDGRELKPSLVHGDMWQENASTNLATGSTVVYDCAAVYGHHEFEIGMWRGKFYHFGSSYLDRYRIHNPHSDPIDQFEDRNRTYSMKHTLVRLLNTPNKLDRDWLHDDFVYLNQKYVSE